MFNFLRKPVKNGSETALTNIPKNSDDVRLDKSVDRLWEAHDHFTKILKDFTDDVKKDTLVRRKTDVQ